MPVQTISMNQVNTVGGNGYSFGGNDAVTINPGILVASTDTSSGNGVSDTFSNSSLDNFGEILSVQFTGVVFAPSADNGFLDNEPYGVISGLYGLDIGGNGDYAKNFGIIVGRRVGVSFDQPSNNVKLDNFGSILGYSVGVSVTNGGGTIYNAGTLSSYRSGISVGNSFGLTISITNTATGRISGNADAIVTFLAGAIVLNNAGTITGTINCASTANDVIVNHGSINGSIYLYSGNDVFNGKGGTSGTIFCGSSNDRVILGKGNVHIHAGRGNSSITAGPGHDQFIFDDTLASQVTKITKFDSHRDRIVLSVGDFAGIGPIGHTLAAADFHVGTHAAAHAQHIIYNQANGFLYYDPDGSGHLPQVHFATISPLVALTHGNFLVEP
jgi:hypothetical protein